MSGEHWLLFQRTEVQFPAPTCWPTVTLITLVSKNLMASSGLHKYQSHMWCRNMNAGKHTHEIKCKQKKGTNKEVMYI